MTEREWERKVFCQAVSRLGHHYESNKDTGRRQFQKKPYDGIIFFLPENVGVFVEIKIENKPMEIDQIKFAELCQEKGLCHYTIRVAPYWVVAYPFDKTCGKIIANSIDKLIKTIEIKVQKEN